MDYTKNYHLPQWVKSDRIMMEDFNQMCADIERGLTGSSAKAQAGLDLYWRLAYNHYSAVQEMEPVPNQSGFFHQNFSKDPSGLTGAASWDQAKFVGKSSVQLTADILKQSYQELTPLKIVSGNLAACKPLTAKFKTPAAGYMSNYALSGSFNDNQVKRDYRLRVTLTNLDTGGVEHSAVTTFTSITGITGGFTNYINTPTYFLGNTNYLITVEALDAAWDMEGHIDFTNITGVVTSANSGILSAQNTIHMPEDSSGGFVVVRCLTGGAGGTLRFLWDGVEREPLVTRMAHMTEGRDYQELIYLREEHIPKDSALSLQFTCKDNGCFVLRDWGAVLF